MSFSCIGSANSPIQNLEHDDGYKNVIENIESSIIFSFSGDKLIIYYNNLPTSVLFEVIDYCRNNRLFSNRINHKPVHKKESYFEPIPTNILSNVLEKSSLKQSEYYVGKKNDMYKYSSNMFYRSTEEINCMLRYIKFHINDRDVKTVKQILLYLQDLIEFKSSYFKTHKTLFTNIMIKFLKNDKRALLAHSVILFRIFSQRLGQSFRYTYKEYFEVFLENLKSEKQFVIQNSLQLIYELHPMFEPSSFIKIIQLGLRSCINYSTKTNYLILLYQLLVDVKKDITKYCPLFLSILFSMKDNYKPMKELRIIIGKYLMKLYKEEELYELFYTYYYEQDIEKLKKLLGIPETYKPYNNNNNNQVKENEFSIKVGNYNYNLTKPIIPLGKSSILLTTKVSERKEINYYHPTNKRSNSTNVYTSNKTDNENTIIHKKHESDKTVVIPLSEKDTSSKPKSKAKAQQNIFEDEIEKAISLEVLIKEYENVVPSPVNLLDYFSDDYSYHTYSDSDSSSTSSIEEEKDRFKEYSLDSEKSSVRGDDELQLLLSSYEDSEEESIDNLSLLDELSKGIPVIVSPILLHEYFTDTNPYNSERNSYLSDSAIEIESIDENKHLDVNLSDSTVKSNEVSDVFLNLNDSEILLEDSNDENVIKY